MPNYCRVSVGMATTLRTIRLTYYRCMDIPWSELPISQSDVTPLWKRKKNRRKSGWHFCFSYKLWCHASSHAPISPMLVHGLRVYTRILHSRNHRNNITQDCVTMQECVNQIRGCDLILEVCALREVTSWIQQRIHWLALRSETLQVFFSVISEGCWTAEAIYRRYVMEFRERLPINATIWLHDIFLSGIVQGIPRWSRIGCMASDNQGRIEKKDNSWPIFPGWSNQIMIQWLLILASCILYK